MKIYEFVNSSNWCQKSLCIDDKGITRAWPYSPNICKWCLTGMLLYCYPGWVNENGRYIYKLIEAKLGMPLHKWNDDPKRSWEQVRDLCKELDV